MNLPSEQDFGFAGKRTSVKRASIGILQGDVD
jgi:hypothetical protein